MKTTILVGIGGDFSEIWVKSLKLIAELEILANILVIAAILAATKISNLRGMKLLILFKIIGTAARGNS